MLKIVAPALAVAAAIYFMKHRAKKDDADEGEHIDATLAAGAYPAE